MYHSSSSKVSASRRLYPFGQSTAQRDWQPAGNSHTLYSLLNLGLRFCTIQLASYWLGAHSRRLDHLWHQFDEEVSRTHWPITAPDVYCTALWFYPHHLLWLQSGLVLICTCSWHSTCLSSPDLLPPWYSLWLLLWPPSSHHHHHPLSKHTNKLWSIFFQL